MDFHQKYGLKKVINASGKMTILGVSKYVNEAIEAQKFGGENFFVMSELIKNTGQYISEMIHAEDSHIVSSASAGIAQSIAGIIGKGSQHHLYHPYSDKIKKREIIIPKGHNVDYGTPVEVMVEVGGGTVIEAGYANMCKNNHIKAMITDKTAAILYIKSHHSVQKNMLSVTEASKVAHEHNLPLIVDAAAEQDMNKYIVNGADLVIYSGAKAFEGPSSGLVIGKSKLMEWVRLQSKGIGRAMKIGKDNILGLAAAIETYLEVGAESGDNMKERLGPLVKELNTLEDISATIIQDSAGRDIYRAEVQIKETSSISATEIVERLKNGQPAIYTREYRVNNDIIELDVRAVNESGIQLISEQMKEILSDQ